MSFENDDSSGYAVLRPVLRTLPGARWSDFQSVHDLESLTTALLDYTGRIKNTENGHIEALVDQALLKNGVGTENFRHIAAIKDVRMGSTLNLKECKDAVDAGIKRARA